MFCKNCGKQSMDDARFCRFCGYEFKNAVQSKQVSEPHKETVRICVKCGKQRMEDNRFCRFCGYEFKDAVQSKQELKPFAEMARVCLKCGNKIEANAVFCRHCGTKIGAIANGITGVRSEQKMRTVSQPQAGRYAGRPKNKKPIFGMVFAAAALILIVWGGVSVWKYQERNLHELTGKTKQKTPVSGYKKQESKSSKGTTTGKKSGSDDYQEEDEIGIITNISYSEKEISAAPAVTAEVKADDATVTVGDICVDFGVMNLAEDCTLSIHELPEKEDSDNGYSMVAWDFDLGEQEEFIIPVEVRLPYDRNKVNDPYFELVPQHYNAQLGRWENLEYEVSDDGYVTVYTQHFSPIGIFKKKDGKMIDVREAKVSFTSGQWINTMRKSMNADDFDRLYNGNLEIANYKDTPNSWINKAATDFGDVSTAAGTADSFFEFLLKDTWKECTGKLGETVSVLGFAYSCYNAQGDMMKKIDAGNYGAVGDYLYKEGPALAANGLSAISGAAQMAKAFGLVSQGFAGALSVSPGLNCVVGGTLLLKSYVEWKRERDAYNKVHFSEQGTYQYTYERFTYANVMYDLEENELVWGLTKYDIRDLKNLRKDSKTLKEFGLTVDDVDEMLKKGEADKKLQRHAIGKSNIIDKYSKTGGFYAYGGYARIMQGIMERNPEEAENWLLLFDVYLERIAKVFTTLSEKEVKIFEAIYNRSEPDYPGYWSLREPKNYIDEMVFQLKYDLTSKKNNIYKDFIKLTKHAMWKETAALLTAEKTYINRKVKINLCLMDKNDNEITLSQSKYYRDKYIILYSDPADRKVEEVEPWEVNKDSLTLAESTFYGYLLWGAPKELRVYESKHDYLAHDMPLETYPVPRIKDGMNSAEVMMWDRSDNLKSMDISADLTYYKLFNTTIAEAVDNYKVQFTLDKDGDYSIHIDDIKKEESGWDDWLNVSAFDAKGKLTIESDYLDAPIDHISEDSLVFKGCNTDTIVIARTGGDGNDKNYTETIAKATLGDDKGSISIQKIEENGKIVLYFEVKIIPQYWDVQETKIENNVRQKPTNTSYSADSSYNNVSLKFRYDTGLDRNHFEW